MAINDLFSGTKGYPMRFKEVKENKLLRRRVYVKRELKAASYVDLQIRKINALGTLVEQSQRH